MAKKYFSFEKLWGFFKNPSNSFKFKPVGTLGSHHMILTHEGGEELIIKGFASSGEPTNTVTLCPGETLGYNSGKLWKIGVADTPFKKVRQYLRVTVDNSRPRQWGNSEHKLLFCWRDNLHWEDVASGKADKQASALIEKWREQVNGLLADLTPIIEPCIIGHNAWESLTIAGTGKLQIPVPISPKLKVTVVIDRNFDYLGLPLSWKMSLVRDDNIVVQTKLGPACWSSDYVGPSKLQEHLDAL